MMDARAMVVASRFNNPNALEMDVYELEHWYKWAQTISKAEKKAVQKNGSH
jgi:hypothetical protein